MWLKGRKRSQRGAAGAPNVKSCPRSGMTEGGGEVGSSAELGVVLFWVEGTRGTGTRSRIVFSVPVTRGWLRLREQSPSADRTIKVARG